MVSRDPKIRIPRLVRPGDSVNRVIAFSVTDFRKASLETLGGGLRTSRPTSRWAKPVCYCFGLVSISKSSLRKGVTGRPSMLKRLQTGLSDQA